jgi:hypothetical protein
MAMVIGFGEGSDELVFNLSDNVESYLKNLAQKIKKDELIKLGFGDNQMGDKYHKRLDGKYIKS